MKNKENSPYANNKPDYIKAPKKVCEGDPKASVLKGKGDLRGKRF